MVAGFIVPVRARASRETRERAQGSGEKSKMEGA
jgi:hypothetical protein